MALMFSLSSAMAYIFQLVLYRTIFSVFPLVFCFLVSLHENCVSYKILFAFLHKTSDSNQNSFLRFDRFAANTFLLKEDIS